MRIPLLLRAPGGETSKGLEGKINVRRDLVQHERSPRVNEVVLSPFVTCTLMRETPSRYKAALGEALQ
jgi:hypothetical protein